MLLRSFIFLLACASLGLQSAGAVSLCLTSEKTVFSCEVGKRVVSVCNSMAKKQLNYVFGESRASAELIINDKPLTSKVYVEASVSFLNGGHQTEYAIKARDRVVDYTLQVRPSDALEEFSELDIYIPKKKPIKLNCLRGTELIDYDLLQILANNLLGEY